MVLAAPGGANGGSGSKNNTTGVGRLRSGSSGRTRTKTTFHENDDQYGPPASLP